MMKKGFTLLELIIVIIIIGVLATLGFTQYGRMVERSRMAEARQIIGGIREFSVGYLLANGTVMGMSNSDVNIGPGADQIPIDCSGSSHYFRYSLVTSAPDDLAIIAYRCGVGGKPPPNQAWYAYGLQSNDNMTNEVYYCGDVQGWGGGPCP